jgi:hypothetical protein
MDAPATSDEFMQATANGEISLDDAKNLITAFSRLRNKWENETPETKEDLSDEDNDSNIEENEQV